MSLSPEGPIPLTQLTRGAVPARFMKIPSQETAFENAQYQCRTWYLKHACRHSRESTNPGIFRCIANRRLDPGFRQGDALAADRLLLPGRALLADRPLSPGCVLPCSACFTPLSLNCRTFPAEARNNLFVVNSSPRMMPPHRNQRQGGAGGGTRRLESTPGAGARTRPTVATTGKRVTRRGTGVPGMWLGTCCPPG